MIETKWTHINNDINDQMRSKIPAKLNWIKQKLAKNSNNNDNEVNARKYSKYKEQPSNHSGQFKHDWVAHDFICHVNQMRTTLARTTAEGIKIARQEEIRSFCGCAVHTFSIEGMWIEINKNYSLFRLNAAWSSAYNHWVLRWIYLEIQTLDSTEGKMGLFSGRNAISVWPNMTIIAHNRPSLFIFCQRIDTEEKIVRINRFNQPTDLIIW